MLQLAVTTLGGIVQPIQPLMVIVPCSGGAASASAATCNGGITFEAFVQNEDIGFVHFAQMVSVKLEAFNFTDNGLIEGKVHTISRDAINQSHARACSVRDEKGQPIQPGLVYAAKIELACGRQNLARLALCDRVQPGMAVQAESKAGAAGLSSTSSSPSAKRRTRWSASSDSPQSAQIANRKQLTSS